MTATTRARRLVLMALVIAFLGGVIGRPAASQGQELPGHFDGETWRDYQAFIVPQAEELAWRQIAWESTLWQAIQRAREEDKPLLLWAMNGHPLGCT